MFHASYPRGDQPVIQSSFTVLGHFMFAVTVPENSYIIKFRIIISKGNVKDINQFCSYKASRSEGGVLNIEITEGGLCTQFRVNILV